MERGAVERSARGEDEVRVLGPLRRPRDGGEEARPVDEAPAQNADREAQATSGARAGGTGEGARPSRLCASTGTGERQGPPEVSRTRDDLVHDVREVADGPLEMVGVGGSEHAGGCGARARAVEAEQRDVRRGSPDEVDTTQPLADRGEAREIGRRHPGEPRAQPLVTPLRRAVISGCAVQDECAQCAEQSCPRVGDTGRLVRPGQAHDDPGGTRPDGVLDRPSEARARSIRVDVLVRTDVCRDRPAGPRNEKDAVGLGSDVDGGADETDEAAPPGGQRAHLDRVVRCAPGPAGRERRTDLARTERCSESVWGDEHVHAPILAHPAEAAGSGRCETMSRVSTLLNSSFAEPAPSPTLLLLGQGADLASERGVECTGDLPPASAPDLVERARVARAALGDRVFVLGHHYQRDEVIAFADVTGDSFKLAREAAARPDAEFIVFCGVHFMAESADILTSDAQQVLLPDLAAGCSMADMAAIDQVEECWDVLRDAGVDTDTVPVTYMNSTAAIKAFTGRHGGTVCTSSNAEVALRWAFDRVGGVDGTGKVLFMPDQHLGRNTALLRLGLAPEDCVVFDPRKPGGGLSVQELRDARMILWRGHCSVHGRFSERNVSDIRAAVPGINVLVHPECKNEVVNAADFVGSTEYIITMLEAAEPGSAWALGTELNLVRRIAQAHPDKQVHYLDSTVCFCSTMNRIDLPHLVWTLESLVAGRVINQVVVDADDAHWARVALDQMLALPGL